MKVFQSALIILILVISCTTKDDNVARSDREEFLAELLSRMTIEEKVGQLNQYSSKIELTGLSQSNESSNDQLNDIRAGKVGSMLNVIGARQTRLVQRIAVEESRLGIPLLFGYDVVHGFKTMFPIPLAEAASWEPDLAIKNNNAAAIETTASGIQWAFSPMMDISFDARWGRVMEGSGEDPFLNSVFAIARVQGFQGTNLADSKTVAACAKHYAAYGFVNAGRDYNFVDISPSRLHNLVLPPFEASVDAGVATVMNAFNEVNGVPATGNTYLLRDILRGQWSFSGVVVSDWGSIGNMAMQGVAQDKSQAAQLALTAGSDIDMESRSYINNLPELIEKNLVNERLLDEAVLRVLRLKYDLGLFEDPYRYGDENQEEMFPTSDHIELARESARRSIILLKNEGGTLPLSKGAGQRIAVIGELAADSDSPLGSWRAQAIRNSAVSLTQALDSFKINYSYASGPRYLNAPGEFRTELSINSQDDSDMENAVTLAGKSDIVLMVLGENCFQSGEGRSQTSVELKGFQSELFEKVRKVNPNIVVVLMNGRPLAIPQIEQFAKAILETWHLGSASGLAIADVLFGDYNPSGKLPVTFPRNTGQLPLSYLNKPISHSERSSKVFWSHYTDESNDPLYPFGFGLSYTTFEYSDLHISKDSISANETVEVSVKLKNTGDRTGEEVVQLYISDLVSSESRPIKELKDFEKVELLPRETKFVSFEIDRKDLEYYYVSTRSRSAESGIFRISIGPNSVEGLHDIIFFE